MSPWAVLGVRRIGAVRSGAVNLSQFKTRSSEPDSSATAANHIHILNEFEPPVLFHVVCLALFLTNGISYLTLLLAWPFDLTRCAHAAVHLTSNRVPLRSNLFVVGFLIVGTMWAWLALHLLATV
jgi:hypothetical protein